MINYIILLIPVFFGLYLISRPHKARPPPRRKLFHGAFSGPYREIDPGIFPGPILHRRSFPVWPAPNVGLNHTLSESPAVTDIASIV